MVKLLNSDSLIQAFRRLLCEERKIRGMSQLDLAKSSGLTRQCIALFESGQRVPTFFSLFCLARGFGMPAARFILMLMDKMEFYERMQEQDFLAADGRKVRWQARR
ncbi:MAG: helix-turn-helix domain-containing protein [Fibromonadales bacterium]|nr:helix-turn-helix domain-containing protein [Fibromonadales bacterium]